MKDAQMVPVFRPALVAILNHTEQSVGRPLTRAEVLLIRDKAPRTLLPREHAETLAEDRGYPDIDPERAWEEWQTVRARYDAQLV